MSDEVRVLVGTIAFGLGINKAGGARGDSSVAAEIDRAVLPGSRTRGPRRPARRLRVAVAEADAGAAGIFRQSDYGCGGAGAGLGALSASSAAFVESRIMPPSADLHALRRNSQVGNVRGLRRLRQRRGVDASATSQQSPCDWEEINVDSDHRG